MSDEQLDNEFKNRIKEVFDNYEDDSAHAGWALLREKYPEKERDRTVIWFWRYAGVAAILLLGIGLWFGLRHKNVKDLTAKSSAHKGPVVINQAAIVKNTPHATDPSQNIARLHAANTTNSIHRIARAALAGTPIAQQSNYSKHAATYQTPVVNSYPTSATINNNTPITVTIQSATASRLNGTVSKNQVSSNAQTEIASTTAGITRPAAGKQSTGPVIAMLDTTKKAPITKKQPDKSIQSLFDNDNKYMAAHHNNNDDIKIKTRSVVFGVYAATYINYSKGSNNQFNAGGGISADIKLTENLSIVTGVAIAQNSFNYNTLTSTSPIVPASAAMAFTARGNAADLEQLSPTSKDLNANLVGLEVPVDLKYLFNPKTGNLYVAAGLSSGGFINETYNYSTSYNIDNNTQPTQDATTKKSLDNFYFGKMLNLSFGVGYPMGNGTKLFIEPFVKYPIAGMGDQHILFGSGGVNLKFNFDAPKARR